MKTSTIENPCMSCCHIYGLNVKHVAQCCQLCGKKYLNEDKSINILDLTKLIVQYNLEHTVEGKQKITLEDRISKRKEYIKNTIN